MRRLAATALTLLGVSVLVFGMVRLVPGTVVEQLLGQAAIASPLSYGDIGLRLTSLFHSPKGKTPVVDSLLHIDGSQLKLSDEPDGWKKAVFDVVALTFGENGQVVDAINRTETLRVRGDVLESLLKDGFVYVMKVPLKKPGAYQLRVAVRDAASERVGSANQYVEVPEFKEGLLAMSGLVAAGAPTNASAANASAPGAPPVQTVGTGQPSPEAEVQASPAVRRFRTGMRLDFGYIIYNAKLDPATGKPRLTTQVSLFRDGRRVFAGEPEAFQVGQQPDLKRLVASGRLRLGADLTPGEYILQAVVTDALAPEKSRTVSQWLDFEIVR